MTPTPGRTPASPARQAMGSARLLAAGAVLPPGAEGAGERAVPLTARTYRHPGLDDRVVVRLVAGELGAAEDLAAGFLGLETAAQPEVVGLGLRRSLGFPEWVLVHHPEDGHHALGVVPDVERAARQVKSKPKAALTAYLEIAGRLAASVPHFLPTFYEQAGRVFLAHENATYASQMFTRARKAEAEHGLAIDEDRLDAVFLEFALAGAVPVKVLSAYAKELAARVPAEEALKRFTRLCLRRTGGGLPPSAQMADDLRKLARAVGQDAATVEKEYLTELLVLPATWRAATGWWKNHRTALIALAKHRPAIRGTLLNTIPGCTESDMPRLWLDILEESGATAALGDTTLPDEEQPRDGATGWLEQFLKFRERARPWNRYPRLAGLYPLVDRMADRLRTELMLSGRELALGTCDVELLDLLLALKVPIDSGHVLDRLASTALPVLEWIRAEASEGRRELLELVKEPRFRAALDLLAPEEVRRLLESPGGRPVVAVWVREAAREACSAGLPALPDSTGGLARLPGEALALAQSEVSAAVDVARELARTLRGGILDELGWPAWEEAVTALVDEEDVRSLVVADAWPYLIVAGPSRAKVIDAEGTVLGHDLRIPAGDVEGRPGFHFVDGELLVYWYSREHQALRGYWHTRADQVLPLEGDLGPRRLRTGHISLPLPGGGRATGAGVLHRGDTAVPGERALVGDGTAFWVWDRSGPGAWREYTPSTGEHGPEAMPGFFSDALPTDPGHALHGRECWLRPAPSAEVTPVGAPVDGLLGWRVVRLPDGSWHGRDLAGRAVTVDSRPTRLLGPAWLLAAVTFPGDDRSRALTLRAGRKTRRIALTDPDGIVTSVADAHTTPGQFAAGTRRLPPTDHWHCLRARDPRGSAALRRVDRETAAALLRAARDADEKELPDRIRALLPEISHDALVTGIAGIVRHAAEQQAALDPVVARLDRALTADRQVQEPARSEPEAPRAVSDQSLGNALNGLLGPQRTWLWPHRDDGVCRQLRDIGRTSREATGPGPGGPAVRVHLDEPRLPHAHLRWEALVDQCAAVAFRAAATTTDPDHRDALCAFLGELDGLGLAASAGTQHWRRFTLHLDLGDLPGRQGGTPSRNGAAPGAGFLLRRAILPLGAGALLAVTDLKSSGTGCEYTALFHDPAGKFEVPPPYTVLSSAPLGEDREAGWLTTFLGELADHGPVPWHPAAAEEFARLTGVSRPLARLVVAGMPYADNKRGLLPDEVRTTLGLKHADTEAAMSRLRGLEPEFRRDVVAALLPARPSRLWTEGPDVAAAAAVWNATVGRQVAVPHSLLTEAGRAIRTEWHPSEALPALLDPSAAPELSHDLAWTVESYGIAPVGRHTAGFTTATLVGTVSLAAWLAHRLPAGDPVRKALPAALAAVRQRLANPELLIDLGCHVRLRDFRKAAGTPAETGDGWERHGAVVLATGSGYAGVPAVRPALLDTPGWDSHLPALRGDFPVPAETALRLARDPRFEEFLTDPGEPMAGERADDGTWWPQDPARSVPDMVTEVAGRQGLGHDAATLYLMLLAMPDPTDRNTARWTGWRQHRGGAARLKAARAELAGTDLVIEATRARAGRSLFLPGGWAALKAPCVPLERWKLPLFRLADGQRPPLGAIVPTEPPADLYRRVWQRLSDGDVPRFEELKVRRGRRR